MVICLEQGADLHMAQQMPLPLTVSCFSKIQIGFTFLVPAHLGSPGKRAVKRARVIMIMIMNVNSYSAQSQTNLARAKHYGADAVVRTELSVKCRRKQASLIVRSLNATGRLFHAVGPATENARRPYVVSL